MGDLSEIMSSPAFDAIAHGTLDRSLIQDGLGSANNLWQSKETS